MIEKTTSRKKPGRMASVMPHGVLFRCGEEREAYKYFIAHGYLEAIIDLPGNLFYGTGIPACILVMNKHGAVQREHVRLSTPPEPYNVRAHLHGGVPKAEAESLAHFWQNYPQLKANAFEVQGRTNAAGAGCTGAAEQMGQTYLDFASLRGDEVQGCTSVPKGRTPRGTIADFVANHQSVTSRREEFMQTLDLIP